MNNTEENTGFKYDTRSIVSNDNYISNISSISSVKTDIPMVGNTSIRPNSPMSSRINSNVKPFTQDMLKIETPTMITNKTRTATKGTLLLRSISLKL